MCDNSVIAHEKRNNSIFATKLPIIKRTDYELKSMRFCHSKKSIIHSFFIKLGNNVAKLFYHTLSNFAREIIHILQKTYRQNSSKKIKPQALSLRL